MYVCVYGSAANRPTFYRTYADSAVRLPLAREGERRDPGESWPVEQCVVVPARFEITCFSSIAL